MTGQIENEGKKYMFGPRKEEIFKIRKQLVAVGIQTFACTKLNCALYIQLDLAQKSKSDFYGFSMQLQCRCIL